MAFDTTPSRLPRLWQGIFDTAGVDSPPILDRWTLRFKRKDLEAFYMEHHWLNMSFWLWRSILVGLVYLAVTLICGDEWMAKAFDVRMDHYTRTSSIQGGKPFLHQPGQVDGINGSASVPDMWRSVKVIAVTDDIEMKIPRAGFLLWHLLWCLTFLIILVVDKKIRSRPGCGKRWRTTRSWVVFAVMVLDLVITSFLNPSVVRFMTFVYVVLVRAQFTQTLCLVLIQSIAMLSAGYVGSHDFLNSVSVAEFLILNGVCILASRQTEIHARLSLYRLWYIVKTDQNSSAFRTGSGVSEKTIAKNLLSLAELKLRGIPEESEFDHGAEFRIQLERAASDLSCLRVSPDLEMPEPPRSQSPPGTPCSSISKGSSSLSSRWNNIRRNSKFGKKSRTWSKGCAPREIGASIDSRTSSGDLRATGMGNDHKAGSSDIAVGSNDSDSDLESCPSEVSCCRSALAAAALPPWLSLEGAEVFRQTASESLDGANCWSEVIDVDRFFLRGSTYLKDQVKTPAPASAFKLHQARMYSTAKPLLHAAKRVPSLQAFLASCPDHFFLIYNRIIPYKDGKLINCITVLVRQLSLGEDPAFDSLWDKFVTGSDDFRNSRLKHVSKMREAPGVVMTSIWMVGGEKPVIIGKGYMDQKCYRGSNYLEIDVDISGSRSARMVVSKVLDHGASVVMEEMLCIEGQSEEELPERPLGAWRWHRVFVEACLIDLGESDLL